MAGGGVKGGVRPWRPPMTSAIRRSRSRHYYSDLHATILHQLGLDHARRWRSQVLGRTMRLVEKEEGKGPIKAILS